MAIVQFELDPEQKAVDRGPHGPAPRRARDRADPGRAVPVPHLLPGHALAHRGAGGQPERAAVRGPGTRVLRASRARAASGADLPQDSADLRRPCRSRRCGSSSRGSRSTSIRLYELLFNNTVEVALASGPDDAAPVVLGPECLRPVGFEAGRGAAAVPGPVVPRLPAADGVLRVPREVPVRRPDRAESAQSSQRAGQPAGDLPLSQPGRAPTWSRTSRPTRSGSAARRS